MMDDELSKPLKTATGELTLYQASFNITLGSLIAGLDPDCVFREVLTATYAALQQAMPEHSKEQRKEAFLRVAEAMADNYDAASRPN